MSDLRDAQRLLQIRARKLKPVVQTHVGDLAWWTTDGTDELEIVREQGEPVAWTWTQDESLDFEAHVDRPELLAPLLERFPQTKKTWTIDADDAKVDALRAAGFAEDESLWFAHTVRVLADVPVPELPDGYTLAHMTEELIDSRIEAHRSAFHPSKMTRQKYERVRAAWPYDEALDRVVLDADGRVVAFALAWVDDENAVGLLEPVGTHADHRRQGLARAACLGALHAMRERGADTALVYPVGTDEGAMVFYRGLGFDQRARHVRFVRA